MMRILLHDYGGYPFCLELSREMAARGHHVQHAFFPAACASMQNTEARPDDPSGLEILPLGTDLLYEKYASLFRRRSQEIAYGAKLTEQILMSRPEAILSANAPLDVLQRAFRAGRAVGARFIFWQQDIISAAMSVILKQRLGPVGAMIAHYYGNVERNIARHSDEVIAIADDFVPMLMRWGVPAERQHVIENWAPKDDIRPQPKDNDWSRAQNLHDKKVFLYSGRLGHKHNPGLLLALAQNYRDDPGVVVLVVAAGQGFDWLAQQKQALGLENLRLLPFQPYSQLANVLATGDVLIGIIESEAHLYSVPSKILSYLAAGRAILAAMPTQNTNAKHITRIEAGLAVPPDDLAGILRAARTLMDSAALRLQYARNARRYAEESFDIGKITDRFLQILSG